jgi:Mor family transcriptional regulator
MPNADWTALNENQQLALSREALRRAAETLADHAEVLATEMDQGTLMDRGGPDALRLFAAVIRATNSEAFGPVGQA